jgi:hypothetical protein
MSEWHQEPVFTVNSHDPDGDVWEEGIYLHFGDTRVRVAESFKGYVNFISGLISIKQEIKEIINEEG